MSKQGVVQFWILNCTLACTVFSGTLGLLLWQSPLAKPGSPEKETAHWPRESSLLRDQRHPNLLIFLDSTCPCSQASLLDLAKVVARWRGRVTAKAILNLPNQSFEGRPHSGYDLLQDLTDLPDVAFCYDPGGRETQRFGISTPGQVVLFDTQGNRQFARGISSSPVDVERLSEEVAKLILKANPNRETSGRFRTPDIISSKLTLRSKDQGFE